MACAAPKLLAVGVALGGGAVAVTWVAMADRPAPEPPEINPLPDTVLVPEARSGEGSIQTGKR